MIPLSKQQIEADIAAVRQAIERHLADVRSTVEQLTASQDQMARQIGQLQSADKEILEKISAPPTAAPEASRSGAQVRTDSAAILAGTNTTAPTASPINSAAGGA